MDVTLYGFPGSNACLATELLLEHAGVTPTHHRLVPMLHVASVKARGFPGPTVPAARIDGTRVQGTRRIARAVADAMPELGLLPLEEPARQRVLDAERQAERFQVAARRIIYGLAQDDASIIRPLVDANFGLVPKPLRGRIVRVMIAAAVRGHRAGRDVTQYELERAAALLDEFDQLVAEGVLGTTQPNVADFQLAPNLALLASLPEAHAALTQRPCWRIADQLCPRYPLAGQSNMPQAWADILAPN